MIVEQIPRIRDLGIIGLHIKEEHGGLGLNPAEIGAVIYELSRVDASLTTFIMLHNFLGISVICQLGSDAQRTRILPDAISLKKILAFGLTEPDYGSDATSLQTKAKKVEGGYLINGSKRWIGNGTMADYIIVWALNEAEGNKIQGFLVEKGQKGLTTSKIENKYALRIT